MKSAVFWLLLGGSAASAGCTGAEMRTCAAFLAERRADPRLLMKFQYLEDTLDACKLVGAVPHFACRFLTDLAARSFASGLEFEIENSDQGERIVADLARDFDALWLRYRDTPLGTYIGPAYRRYLDALPALKSEISLGEFLISLALTVSDEVRVFVYSLQRMNIMLHAFEKFPTANSTAGVALPHFRFAHLLGARWEVALELLAGVPQPVVAEIGVFRGFFSEFVLSSHPGLTLIGVDPYYGLDGTFPPPEKAEEVAKPEEIYQLAQAKYDRFPGRASLLRMSSVQAAKLVPDESLDLVFIDGCHEMPCVAEDLQHWIGKVKPGGVVMGHDYSERWPGVMVVLNELRKDKDLYLGSDLVWWFYKD